MAYVLARTRPSPAWPAPQDVHAVERVFLEAANQLSARNAEQNGGTAKKSAEFFLQQYRARLRLAQELLPRGPPDPATASSAAAPSFAIEQVEDLD